MEGSTRSTRTKSDKAEQATREEAVDGSDPLGTDKGYIGVAVDPIPNEEHSLESGPDAPSIPEQAAALASSEAELAGAAARDR